MKRRNLGVWLDGLLVAHLAGNRPGFVQCTYTDEALTRWPGNIPVLSCSLPLRSGRLNGWAFATGLLPEGHHRQAMAAIAGVTTLDVLGLLERFGRDVAGAVIVSADDPPLREPSVEPYTPDMLVEAVADLKNHPLGLYDDSELSIAGLADKMLLTQVGPGQYGRPRHGAPSTHILKVDDQVRKGLVRAEHACLQLALAAGLSAASSEVMPIGDTECILVERFDRTQNPDRTVQRLHQEDACQALGIDPESNHNQAKYQESGGPSLAGIARLLETWAAEPETELLSLVDVMTFTVLIGNADAHGKNLALLHPAPGEIRLAPLYDTVPTVLWPALRTRAAMSVNGTYPLAAITLDDVAAEARGWSLNPSDARARATATAERVHQALHENLVDVDSPALELFADRTRAFLSS
jgi:serine/threonine-protein kinase HipA